MTVQESEYTWSRYVTTVPEGTTAFEQPIKIYAVKGDGVPYLDTEATQPITAYPVAVDSITVVGGSLTLIGEQGRGVPVASTYLDTAEGMTKSELTRTQSEVITLPFAITWNGAQYTEITLYGNGRVYINGTSAIRIHSYWLASWMDAYNGLYTQTGTSGGRQFFKIRFDGTCVYSNTTSDSYKSIWELFLFDDGSVFINSIYCPTVNTTNNFYIGAAQTYTVNPGGSQYIVATSADDGVTWAFDYLDGAQRTTLFLVRKGGTIHTVADGMLTATDVTELTGAAFLEYGFATLSDFVPEGEYSVLCWSTGSAPTVSVKVTGSPPPQELTCTVDMSHPSISSIQQLSAEYSGTVELSHKTDGGWIGPGALSDWVAQDTAALWASLGADKLLHLKFHLYGGAEFTRFKITYKN
ncbi:MAG: hypothetical protein J6K98_04590 [Clostridia bacterium]|nr:hypothetical protein [Clostridia bacterium]